MSNKKAKQPIENETIGEAMKIDKSKALSPAMEQLIENNRVLELIKTQFGYSGYSHPNYLAVCKTIEDNKKFIDGK